ASEPSEPLPVSSPALPPSPTSRFQKTSSKSKRKSTPNLPHFSDPKPPPTPPKVKLTTRINSNDQVYILHLDTITPLPEYLSSLDVEQQATTPQIPSNTVI